MTTTSTGVPDLRELRSVTTGTTFADMEAFSARFLERNHDALAYYRHRWTADPLHAWSRRWEYPFIYEALAKNVNKPGRILDAGAGATFFPFYISDRISDVTIEAVDSDPKLAEVYAHEGDHTGVSFNIGDITAMNYADGHFDAAYSVSVIEHIPDRATVSSELARVLKPGSPLVLTIDVSVDGRHEIPLDQAEALIDALHNHFEPVSAPPLRAEATDPQALLTSRLDPDEVGWRWTMRMRAHRLIKQHKSPFRMMPELTVYGSVWRKR